MFTVEDSSLLGYDASWGDKSCIKVINPKYKSTISFKNGENYSLSYTVPQSKMLVSSVRVLQQNHYALQSFNHSIGMCRMWWFLAVLRSIFNSPLLHTPSFHHFPPTSLPSSLTSSYHLFLGLPLSFVVSKFKCNTFWGILFSSILCTCPNQHNLFNLIVGFLTFWRWNYFFNFSTLCI